MAINSHRPRAVSICHRARGRERRWELGGGGGGGGGSQIAVKSSRKGETCSINWMKSSPRVDPPPIIRDSSSKSARSSREWRESATVHARARARYHADVRASEGRDTKGRDTIVARALRIRGHLIARLTRTTPETIRRGGYRRRALSRPIRHARRLTTCRNRASSLARRSTSSRLTPLAGGGHKGRRASERGGAREMSCVRGREVSSSRAPD